MFSENLRGIQKKIAADTQHHLDCYAKDGLRTLCFTKKVHSQIHYIYQHFLTLDELCFIFFLRVLQVVSDKEYKSWFVNRQRALAAIENREQLVMDTSVQLETNLCLLGNIHQPNTYCSY